MATMDDILGNGGGTPPPKGSKEWHEQQQDAPSVSSPAKGTQKWTEQQAAAAPIASAPQIPASQKNMPPTSGGTSGENVQTSSPVEIKTGQQVPVNHGKVVREFGDGVHAFMEDGTIRTSGFAGYTYSTPENMSNIDLFKVLNPYTPPTAEELEKEKKKQKRDQIFAAIGDGISALSNLFFTTQYAPNMYTGKNTMSERTKVRYDKLMKEREGKEKEYYEGLMKAKIADEEGDDRERKWQRLLRLDDYNRMRNDAKEERDRQLFELNLQLQGNKISASEADAKRKGIEAKYAEELEKARLETEKAKVRYYNRGGGSGKAGEYPWYDSDGNKHFARSYEAMRQNAIDNGTWNEETQASTTEVKSGRGKTVKTSETTKPGKGHSSKPQKKSPTADNKKKSPTS
mgnify:CR=1 FL=1